MGGKKKENFEDSLSEDMSESLSSSGDFQRSGKKEGKKKKIEWSIYRKFFGFTIKRWKLALVSVILTIISGILTSIFPWKVGVVLDMVTEATRDNVEANIQKLKHHVYSLACLGLLMGVFTFLRYIRMQLFQERLSIDIKTHIYERFIRNDLYFFEKHKTGELISRLGTDINQAKSAISNNLTFLLRNILTILGNIFILFMMSWKLTLCVLVVVPLYAFIVFQCTKKTKMLVRERQDIEAEMTSHVGEKFNGIQIVKSFCSEEQEIGRYQRINEQLYGTNWKRTMYQGIQMTASTILPSIGIVIVLWYGGNLMINGESELTPGELASFIMYCSSLSTTTSAISNSYTNIINGAYSCQKVFEMLEYAPLVN